MSEDLHYAPFLRGDGGVTAWGWMDSAAGTTVRARVPDGLGSVVAVAAGTRSAMALRSDGTLVSWRASLKECPIPEIASVNVTSSIQAAGLLRLSVGVPSQPEVVRPPQDVSVHSWQSAHFDVEAHGFGLQFQWYTNGTAVSGLRDQRFMWMDPSWDCPRASWQRCPSLWKVPTDIGFPRSRVPECPPDPPTRHSIGMGTGRWLSRRDCRGQGPSWRMEPCAPGPRDRNRFGGRLPGGHGSVPSMSEGRRSDTS